MFEFLVSFSSVALLYSFPHITTTTTTLYKPKLVCHLNEQFYSGYFWSDIKHYLVVTSEYLAWLHYNTKLTQRYTLVSIYLAGNAMTTMAWHRCYPNVLPNFPWRENDTHIGYKTTIDNYFDILIIRNTILVKQRTN